MGVYLAFTLSWSGLVGFPHTVGVYRRLRLYIPLLVSFSPHCGGVPLPTPANTAKWRVFPTLWGCTTAYIAETIKAESFPHTVGVYLLPAAPVTQQHVFPTLWGCSHLD